MFISSLSKIKLGKRFRGLKLYLRRRRSSRVGVGVAGRNVGFSGGYFCFGSVVSVRWVFRF